MKWIVVWKGKDSGRCVRSLPMDENAAYMRAEEMMRFGWAVQVVRPRFWAMTDMMSDDDLRKLWLEHGGKFHGPNVETGEMPESKLLPLLRSLLADTSRLDYLEAEANEDPITLHNNKFGTPKHPRGLGLQCTGRTLRKAIDDMRGINRAETIEVRVVDGPALPGHPKDRLA